ncbi:MAG TPA: 2-succinyl-6-hydroxy-2,4-cyclohexadiene-1-carboxylate synthase, partial [Chloroflexota bacterium]|nr:2-succinyl-6-hydroxy-2,4-cyclohexadiene-1-carboxylate synthase [Chloroflexota bacterium]
MNTRHAFHIHGIAINVEHWGAGVPLVALHGFTGSAATWRRCLGDAGTATAPYAVDLVGHGRTDSPADLEHYSMPAVVADLVALLDRLTLPRVALLGYSMGGRVALQFAVAHPERVVGLLLESASPGIADPGERAARRCSDEALADRILRDGVPAFVAEWEALPLFRSQARLPPAVREAQRAQRFENNPLGLANSLRGMGAGVQDPVWDALPRLTMPVLLLTGAEDDKYVALARAMADRLPAAELIVAPAAGHTIHLEHPRLFQEAVRR